VAVFVTGLVLAALIEECLIQEDLGAGDKYSKSGDVDGVIVISISRI